jgi:hypothetical protein
MVYLRYEALTDVEGNFILQLTITDGDAHLLCQIIRYLDHQLSVKCSQYSVWRVQMI